MPKKRYERARRAAPRWRLLALETRASAGGRAGLRRGRLRTENGAITNVARVPTNSGRRTAETPAAALLRLWRRG